MVQNTGATSSRGGEDIVAKARAEKLTIGGINETVMDLFPSTVVRYEHNFPPIDDEVEDVINFIREEEQQEINVDVDPVYETGERRNFLGGYADRVPNLTNFIKECCQHYIGHDNFEIPQSWLNLYPKGTCQEKHLHPGWELAGVYYHRTRQHNGIINFHSPLSQAYLECFATQRDIAVETFPNTLLLFPGWLEHSTTPNGSHEQKTSIGLNIKVHKTGEYALEGQWVGKHSLLWAPPKFLNQDWPNPTEGQKSS